MIQNVPATRHSIVVLGAVLLAAFSVTAYLGERVTSQLHLQTRAIEAQTSMLSRKTDMLGDVVYNNQKTILTLQEVVVANQLVALGRLNGIAKKQDESLTIVKKRLPSK